MLQSSNTERMEMLEQLCDRYFALHCQMQEIEAYMSILKQYMRDLDLDITEVVRVYKIQ